MKVRLGFYDANYEPQHVIEGKLYPLPSIEYGTVETTPDGLLYTSAPGITYKRLRDLVEEYRLWVDPALGTPRKLTDEELVRSLPQRHQGLFVWAYIVDDQGNPVQLIGPVDRLGNPIAAPAPQTLSEHQQDRCAFCGKPADDDYRILGASNRLHTCAVCGAPNEIYICDQCAEFYYMLALRARDHGDPSGE